MTDMKFIDVKEFREIGFLQEANRRFFHPLGLALFVNIDENGNETIGGVLDYRDDPEGVMYAPGFIDAQKAANVQALLDAKAFTRLERFGQIVQQVDDGAQDG